MKKLRHFLLVRHRHNWILFLRFGLVGASGVIVNMLTLALLETMGPHETDVWLDLPGLVYNIRWYHIYVTGSFFVANLWNFQLNRSWTFASSKHVGWWREYIPFLCVGLMAQLVGLLVVTMLMNPGSPIALPTDVFDDSDALHKRLYWANFITIAVVTPLSFVLNKLWTFNSVRGETGGRGA